ncbi:hypothetical protein FGO68_gene6385 [Halteria grandinella]|uniref:Uncharacterized protein n=1 Tax=Halteria grandinella TaxID=5974 RepID=A0A8J8P5S8_HALGN|nr:hypothetical protein FGO68_gene6385 [Halteria grandinella]
MHQQLLRAGLIYSVCLRVYDDNQQLVEQVNEILQELKAQQCLGCFSLRGFPHQTRENSQNHFRNPPLQLIYQ